MSQSARVVVTILGGVAAILGVSAVLTLARYYLGFPWRETSVPNVLGAAIIGFTTLMAWATACTVWIRTLPTAGGIAASPDPSETGILGSLTLGWLGFTLPFCGILCMDPKGEGNLTPLVAMFAALVGTALGLSSGFLLGRIIHRSRAVRSREVSGKPADPASDQSGIR